MNTELLEIRASASISWAACGKMYKLGIQG